MQTKKSGQARSSKMRWITALELVVLLDNVFKAAEDPDIGYVDPRETLRHFLARLNRPIRMYTEDIESALWSCNLLNEKGKFRHPRGWSFDEFLRRALRGDKFNKDYNFIEGYEGSVL